MTKMARYRWLWDGGKDGGEWVYMNERLYKRTMESFKIAGPDFGKSASDFVTLLAKCW